MYTPRHFAVDADETRRLLSVVESGNLVTATDDGLIATLLPWMLDPTAGEHGTLIAHLARTNPQWKTPSHGEALVIADLPQGYISPSYYATKAEHGRVVPTWNYAALHVYGDLVVHEDETWLADAVRRLTDMHEEWREEPWAVDDAPADYIDGMLRAIVGVELRITRVEAKVKMSQNRSEADIAGVIAGLENDAELELAEWVRDANR